jgi:hypothetical protein
MNSKLGWLSSSGETEKEDITNAREDT